MAKPCSFSYICLLYEHLKVFPIAKFYISASYSSHIPKTDFLCLYIFSLDPQHINNQKWYLFVLLLMLNLMLKSEVVNLEYLFIYWQSEQSARLRCLLPWNFISWFHLKGQQLYHKKEETSSWAQDFNFKSYWTVSHTK